MRFPQSWLPPISKICSVCVLRELPEAAIAYCLTCRYRSLRQFLQGWPDATCCDK